MDPNLLWLIPVVVFLVGFAVLEWWGLKRPDDRMQPLTYWVRRYFGLGKKRSYLSIGWIAITALIVWLFIHFALEGTFL